MYNIYFGKRRITLCTPDEKVLKDPNAVILKTDDNFNYTQIIEVLDNSPAIRHLMIYTESDLEYAFKKFRSVFKEVNAGGGLIHNENKDYLLIFRNDMWDLPKGKQEDGEEISKTALREVEEECGIDDMELGDLICITHHCYRIHNEFILKHTHWFNMACNKKCYPVPQREENITKAEWISREIINDYLKDTYPSIKEVFDNTSV